MHCSICHSDVVDGYYGGHICGGVPTACGPNCCGHKELQARLTHAEKEIEREHELFLVTHRENMKAVERIHELKTHLEAAEAKIAGLEKEKEQLNHRINTHIGREFSQEVRADEAEIELAKRIQWLEDLESSHNALRGAAEGMFLAIKGWKNCKSKKCCNGALCINCTDSLVTCVYPFEGWQSSQEGK